VSAKFDSAAARLRGTPGISGRGFLIVILEF
jgi:hypothetical protein